MRTNLTILSGDDSLTLPMLAVGAEGVVSVIANLVPRDVMALVEAFQAGQIAEARQWHARLFPLCRDLLALAPNPIPLKTALASAGPGQWRAAVAPLPSRRPLSRDVASQPRSLWTLDRESVMTYISDGPPHIIFETSVSQLSLRASFLRLIRKRIYASGSSATKAF